MSKEESLTTNKKNYNPHKNKSVQRIKATFASLNGMCFFIVGKTRYLGVDRGRACLTLLLHFATPGGVKVVLGPVRGLVRGLVRAQNGKFDGARSGAWTGARTGARAKWQVW